MASEKQQKTNNKINFKGKWIRRIIIPLLLFIFWMVLSFFYSTSKASPTILIHEHSKENITSGKSSELLKGETIRGEFEAKENNLGIVAVRFNTFFRINDDSVIFRLKEKGERDWYYEYSYLVDQFQPNDYFTFGFPIITDSLEKIYQFEVESVMGEPENAVALSMIEPVYVTKYQYSKAEIVSNQDYLRTYAYRKIINTFSNVDFLLSFFAYSLPLVLYLIWLFFFEKYLYNKYHLALIPIGLMILISIFNPPNNDAIVLGLTGLWMAVALVYKLKTIMSFYFSLAFLASSPLLLYTAFPEIAKNISMWAFMLLSVGIILQIIEFRWKREKQLGFSIFSLKPKNKKSDSRYY